MNTKNDNDEESTAEMYPCVWNDNVETGRSMARGEFECCGRPGCIDCNGTGRTRPRRTCVAGGDDLRTGYGVLAAVVGEFDIHKDEHLLSDGSRAFLAELRSGLGEKLGDIIRRAQDLGDEVWALYGLPFVHLTPEQEREEARQRNAPSAE